MNPSIISIIEQCAADSKAGAIGFADVVMRLGAAGVESYFADYRHGFTTYYLPGGETHAVPLNIETTEVAPGFDAAAVLAAIRGAQAGVVKYRQFVAMTCAAGCIGYMVWIAGRHVTYFGRNGETHVEHFPQ